MFYYFLHYCALSDGIFHMVSYDVLYINVQYYTEQVFGVSENILPYYFINVTVCQAYRVTRDILFLG